MLQLAQRMSAPSACSVSISTAVWIVMCKLPAIRAPLSGWLGAYFLRIAIKPGISCSAIAISLRPHDASSGLAITKSSDFDADLLFFLTGVLPAKAVIHVSPKG